MKKLLMTAGILLLIACVLFICIAVLHLLGYRHALDGSPVFYDRMHRRAILFSVIAAVLAVGGAVCVLLYFKRGS